MIFIFVLCRSFTYRLAKGVNEAIRLAYRALKMDPQLGSFAALAGGCHCHMLNVLLGNTNDPQFDRKEAVKSEGWPQSLRHEQWCCEARSI